eukprot:2657905-Amphidinium_carterae.1
MWGASNSPKLRRIQGKQPLSQILGGVSLATVPSARTKRSLVGEQKHAVLHMTEAHINSAES